MDASPTKSPKKSPAKVKSDSDSESSDDDGPGEDSDREEPGENQKVYETVPLNAFKDLYKVAPIYKYIDEFGSFIAPLTLIGHFFNYAGNHLLHYTESAWKKRIFYPGHRVISIQLLANGEITTTCMQKVINIQKVEGKYEIKVEKREQMVVFRSRTIVLSNGGTPCIPRQFYKEWFPFMKGKESQVLLADKFLKKDLYKETMNKINSQKLKNIVIVGASHSGFASAWIMLHGPALYNQNNCIRNTKHQTFPEAQMKRR